MSCLGSVLAFASCWGSVDYRLSTRTGVREEGDAVLFRPTVSDWPKGLRLNSFDGPQVYASTKKRPDGTSESVTFAPLEVRTVR